MGTHRIIYIRTDGNAKIASGHLVRCLSIACACQMLGMEVHFLVSDAESLDLLREIGSSCEGFTFTRLKTALFQQLEQELPEVLSLLSSHAAALPKQSQGASSAPPKPVYLLDSYYVTENYLTALRPFAKTVYLDDLRLFDYPVDLLINYDVIPDDRMALYKSSYQNAGQLLLGASYAPLRAQFQDRRTITRAAVTNILITTGGSDPVHLCLHLARRIADDAVSADIAGFKDIQFHIVVGKLNTDKEALRRLAGRSSLLKLHENISDMTSLMAGCDLAVSAAGTTLYELCALGIPAVSFILADNQTDSAKAFDDAGAVPCAGDMRTSPQRVLGNILRFISENAGSSADSCNRRIAIHNKMNRLVDGEGARRIADALKNL